jgi:hypothetical protein
VAVEDMVEMVAMEAVVERIVAMVVKVPPPVTVAAAGMEAVVELVARVATST